MSLPSTKTLRRGSVPDFLIKNLNSLYSFLYFTYNFGAENQLLSSGIGEKKAAGMARAETGKIFESFFLGMEGGEGGLKGTLALNKASWN